jgi:hypothetical protein
MASTSRRILCLVAALVFVPSYLVRAQIPTRLSDAAFWQMITDFSEPEGKFESNPNNFVSNESSFQAVVPRLLQTRPTGGVYIGVGPDQNFTYIIALQPRISFIVDIRRQNMLHHLMYKAIIELSGDRADFLSILFSRKRPEGLDSAPLSSRELFDIYADVPPDPAFRTGNVRAVIDRLIRHHGFRITPEDERIIEFIHRAFFEVGPDLTYTGARSRMPTYSQLLSGSDGQNQNRSYMADEKNFQTLKDLQERNVIVPIVGDFAGNRAFRAVGGYLKNNNSVVTALYTSNVEQYLYEVPGQPELFYSNVAALPLDGRSVFVRAFLNVSLRTPGGVRGSATLLSPIQDFLRAVTEKRIATYDDVFRFSR